MSANPPVFRAGLSCVGLRAYWGVYAAFLRS